jgi:hypothetical protein
MECAAAPRTRHRDHAALVCSTGNR